MSAQDWSPARQTVRWGRTRGVSREGMRKHLGCSDYRLGKLLKDKHWLAQFLILEAANRCIEETGRVGFQTDIFHFVGDAKVAGASPP